MILNCGVGEYSGESLGLQGDPASPSWRRSVLGCSLEGLMLKLNLQYFATWCKELTQLKRPWCWDRLKGGGEGDDRGWDGWMASPTQWTWVNSRSWWWTGKPAMLQSMGSQRVGHDWATELNWTESFVWERFPFEFKVKGTENSDEHIIWLVCCWEHWFGQMEWKSWRITHFFIGSTWHQLERQTVFP